MSQSAEPLTILVVRTGGFAGLRRAWRVAADEGSSPTWRALVDACPWDAATVAAPAEDGADRYVWEVTAADGEGRHPLSDDGARHAVLGERAVEGPWRDLIDAVRDGGEVTAPDQVASGAAALEDAAPDDVSD